MKLRWIKAVSLWTQRRMIVEYLTTGHGHFGIPPRKKMVGSTTQGQMGAQKRWT